jgi:hypothetical protein
MLLLKKIDYVGLVGHVDCMNSITKLYKILVRKPEEKKPLEKPRRRWEKNVSILNS